MRERSRKYPFDFLVLPEAIWLDERISYGAKHLLAILLRYANEGFYKEVSYRWLEEKMRVKQREAMYRIEELIKNGFITRIERKGRVNGYKINVGIWDTTPAQMHTPAQQVQDTPAQGMHPYTREDIQENITASPSASGLASSFRRGRPDSEGDEREVDLESGEERPASSSSPNTVKRKQWLAFSAYWRGRVEAVKGFTPEVTAKDMFRFLAVRKKYGQQEVSDLVEWFLASDKSDRHCTIAACLSADSFNSWRMR